MEVLDLIARKIYFHTVRVKGAVGSIQDVREALKLLKTTNPNMDADRFLAIAFLGEADVERYHQLRETL